MITGYILTIEDVLLTVLMNFKTIVIVWFFSRFLIFANFISPIIARKYLLVSFCTLLSESNAVLIAHYKIQEYIQSSLSFIMCIHTACLSIRVRTGQSPWC